MNSSKNDESKTSHGMVAVYAADQSLPSDDLRLPSTVLTAAARSLSTARPVHSSIGDFRAAKIRREAKRFKESRFGRHWWRHPDQPDFRQCILVVEHVRFVENEKATNEAWNLTVHSNIHLGMVMQMFFNGQNAQNFPSKSDDIDNGVAPSPWANIISVGLKIITALLGGGANNDGIDKVDNGNSPMQVRSFDKRDRGGKKLLKSLVWCERRSLN